MHSIPSIKPCDQFISVGLFVANSLFDMSMNQLVKGTTIVSMPCSLRLGFRVSRPKAYLEKGHGGHRSRRRDGQMILRSLWRMLCPFKSQTNILSTKMIKRLLLRSGPQPQQATTVPIAEITAARQAINAMTLPRSQPAGVSMDRSLN